MHCMTISKLVVMLNTTRIKANIGSVELFLPPYPNYLLWYVFLASNIAEIIKALQRLIVQFFLNVLSCSKGQHPFYKYRPLGILEVSSALRFRTHFHMSRRSKRHNRQTEVNTPNLRHRQQPRVEEEEEEEEKMDVNNDTVRDAQAHAEAQAQQQAQHQAQQQAQQQAQANQHPFQSNAPFNPYQCQVPFNFPNPNADGNLGGNVGGNEGLQVG